MRRPLIILATVVVAATLAIGIAQTSGGGDDEPSATAPSPTAALEALEGAPAPLAGLHRQANALLAIEDFDDRIEALRGHPIVVNVWGSWCNPCREEFPVFQRVSAKLGKRVAFLGLATQDSKEAAGGFLRSRPVSYPSYMDFEGKQADAFGVIAAPATVFYDAQGEKTYLHQGKYETDQDLIDDIERYAGA